MNDIRARTFEFARQIVLLSQILDKRRDSITVLTSQLLRAGTSIGANLEEASASRSQAEFISTCGIARREARETLYWLRLFDSLSAVPPSFSGMLKEADEIVAILTTIVRNAENKRKGSQRKH